MNSHLSRTELVMAVVIGLVFTGIGGSLLYSEYQATADADPVDATVLSSTVVETDGASRNDAEPGYDAVVEYQYRYGGRTYTSTSLCPGVGSGCTGTDSESSARDTVDRFPAGETVTAYVDPGDPSRAYLIQPGVTLVYFVPVGMGLLVLGIAVSQVMGGD